MSDWKLPKTIKMFIPKMKKHIHVFAISFLFRPVNNREMKNEVSEYQAIDFLHARLLTCYFTVIFPVTALLFPVFWQVSFYIKQCIKKIKNKPFY
jgi:hypothetical protein